MSKDQPCIVVAQREDGWTLYFSGRTFDRFASQEQAIDRALEWARNAEKQGQRVSVLLEGGDGQRTPVWPPAERAT
ncbi:MAG TPA: hypothetical protein VHG92_10620 [Afifellaceae bacterium]|nr:hypothetical protein [Afifellaceae bacterium]